MFYIDKEWTWLDAEHAMLSISAVENDVRVNKTLRKHCWKRPDVSSRRFTDGTGPKPEMHPQKRRKDESSGSS